ncbi:MAG: hypothetical protein M1420_00240 [Actinobacteria bacterium]|nr:hypothetical protein [Actinomycetota bacterium]
MADTKIARVRASSKRRTASGKVGDSYYYRDITPFPERVRPPLSAAATMPQPV